MITIYRKYIYHNIIIYLLYDSLSHDNDNDGFDSPLAHIPANMLEEMLTQTTIIGNNIFNNIYQIKKEKETFRNQLINEHLLGHDNNFKFPILLTTCGIDGAYAIERLLGTDLIAIGTIGVDGLVNKYKYFPEWKEKNHSVFMSSEKHNSDNVILARGLMIELEINLAAKAPHDLIFLDGSLTTALIHMYKAINILKDLKNQTTIKILEKFKEFLISYNKILNPFTGKENSNLRSIPQLYVGIPKYTSRNDIGNQFCWPNDYDDRAILTLILNEGEYTKPRPFANKENWHKKLPNEDKELDALMTSLLQGIKNLNVIYYKPHYWCPALRIEIPSYIATDEDLVSGLLQTIKYQCSVPGIIEPYPLFLADKMVKNISPALPAYKQIITRNITENQIESNDVGDILFMMHSYRTESDI